MSMYDTVVLLDEKPASAILEKTNELEPDTKPLKGIESIKRLASYPLKVVSLNKFPLHLIFKWWSTKGAVTNRFASLEAPSATVLTFAAGPGK